MLFYRCNKCGNFVTFLTKKSGCTPMCCGEEMTEVVPNTVDAAFEKHVPVVEKDGNNIKVKVGSVAHPMMEEHYIQFVILETDKGYQKKDLKPGEVPEACFVLAEGEKAVAAYEYCNLHGLWKADI
ncbi:MAG: desulfoferrodoxin Dfx [Acetatifactor sp.]|nr:desulfoferrodoxin Dfx [Acetatifactor sp.]